MLSVSNDMAILFHCHFLRQLVTVTSTLCKTGNLESELLGHIKRFLSSQHHFSLLVGDYQDFHMGMCIMHQALCTKIRCLLLILTCILYCIV